MQLFYVDAAGNFLESIVDGSPEDVPENYIEVPFGPFYFDQVWQFPEGPYSPSRHAASLQESQWRDAELAAVPDEIAKVEDDDPAAIGTVEEWRVYRKTLRLWGDANPEFPFGTRPNRPA